MTAAPDLDLHCVECRYNLRGLAREALCPECGAPAERSFLHRELEVAGVGVPLRLADAAWVRSLARACTALAVVGVCDAALGTLMILPVALRLAMPVRFALFSAVELAAWAPAWRLARAEPGAPRGRQRALRLAIRAAVTAAMLVVPVTMLCFLTGRVNWIIDWPLPALRTLASAAAAGLTFAYLRRLARRAEAPALARAALALAAAAPAVLLLQLVPFLRVFRIDSPGGSADYGVTPMHVLGHTQVLPLFAWALITRARLGLDHVAWGFMTAAGLASVAVFYRAGRVFAGVRRTIETGRP